ncbi:MAG: TetR/AcrR family transcriptional regulator [Bacillus sp. (in: Bacteria)]|nr:TetR/AcrR family transcriptional regulator [Bacillus sp. (in: firmicutes)]
MDQANKQIAGINQKETYQTIVKNAQHMFLNLGYRAVSTRQIAQICGITQPALYHYFKNKQALYVAVIQHTLHHTEIDVNKILNEFTTFQERLTEITIYMMVHFEMDMSQMFHDISHELTPEDQQQIYQWWVKGFLLPLLIMIDDGVSRGEIKDPQAINSTTTELAYFILNLIKSILVPAGDKNVSISERKKLVDKQAKLIIEIFIHGIGI